MKTFTLKLTYAFLFSMLFISCTQDEDGIYEEESLTLKDVSVSYTVMEYQIFSLVNEHRESIGLEKLNIINLISAEAEDHTDYMIQTGIPSHDNFPIRHQNLVKNVKAKKVGENVAYGYSSAEAVVKAWIKSDGHRQNIENPNFTDFGISTKKNKEGRNYFTHIFIKR
ncbi:MAG: hypothetical protein BM563_02445 [Bacteroidetes bacterium MedPE-SWsnd-G1]|nr:MAG: hypothetical protein BM563_02445 [Bacteroidetes bacterium MedPE-SWsnd-G1]